MTNASKNESSPGAGAIDEAGAPALVDRATWQAELEALRLREKAHTREGSAIAAARRRLPMVEVDARIQLVGSHGPLTLLDTFERLRRQLVAYYFMWHAGRPAASQCEGCTLYTSQVQELSYFSIPATSPTRRSAPGLVRRERTVPRLHGLEAAVVFGTRRSTEALHVGPGFALVSHLRKARPGVRDVPDQGPRRGSDGRQLRAPRRDRVRAAGTVGAIASRLAGKRWGRGINPYRSDAAGGPGNERPIAQWSRVAAGALRRSSPRGGHRRSGTHPRAVARVRSAREREAGSSHRVHRDHPEELSLSYRDRSPEPRHAHRRHRGTPWGRPRASRL